MSPAEMAAILAKNPLFSRLSPDDLQRLLGRIYFPVSAYEKGKRVAFRGDRYDELGIILRGTLQAEVTDLRNRTMIVEQLSAPQTIASAIFLADDNRLPVDVVAKTDVKIARISRSQLMSLFREWPGCLEGFLGDIGGRVQFLAARLRLNTFSTLSQKLAVYLLELALSVPGSFSAPAPGQDRGSGTDTDSSANPGPGTGSNPAATLTIQLPHSKQEMADLFGAARPSVSRVCSELEAQGLIGIRGRTVTIPDLARLKELATGDMREE